VKDPGTGLEIGEEIGTGQEIDPEIEMDLMIGETDTTKIIDLVFAET